MPCIFCWWHFLNIDWPFIAFPPTGLPSKFSSLLLVGIVFPEIQEALGDVMTFSVAVRFQAGVADLTGLVQGAVRISMCRDRLPV